MIESTVQITVRDESVPRSRVSEFLLRLGTPRLSGRDLIAERVRFECDRRLVSTDGEQVVPLIERTFREVQINDTLPHRSQPADNPELQIEKALEGFQRNAFVMLVDDEQVVELSSEITVTDETIVTFLMLTPLQGG